MVTDDRPLGIAVVGCGAIAEMQYLRLLSRHPHCRIEALVDPNRGRLEELAERFSVPHVFDDHTRLTQTEVEAVIVAAPNYLHAPIGVDLLDAGFHVLVEKPMALTRAECDEMIKAADGRGVTLAVALMRRYSVAGRFAKWAIDSGLLGRITGFDIKDGFVYTWPVKSDFLLSKDKAGGGVLVDTGAHTLDQLLWWLGPVSRCDYYDDNYGGIEADCRLELEMASGARGTVELSRTRDLPGTAVLEGEHARLKVSLVSNHVELEPSGAGMSIKGEIRPQLANGPVQASAGDLIIAEYEDFFQAVRSGRPPTVTGEVARGSVGLIEDCYANRRPWHLPWVEPDRPNEEEVAA